MNTGESYRKGNGATLFQFAEDGNRKTDIELN